MFVQTQMRPRNQFIQPIRNRLPLRRQGRHVHVIPIRDCCIFLLLVRKANRLLCHACRQLVSWRSGR